jgi:hypothetical protein
MTMTTLSKPISVRKPDQHKSRTDWTARREWRRESARLGTDSRGLQTWHRAVVAWAGVQ